MKVEKFPALKFQNKDVQWDTRQSVADPLVVLRKDLAADVEAELQKKSTDVLREGQDFDSWGAWVANIVGHPSRQLKVIGIVGTNGKTTTNALVRFLLVEAGKRVLEIGTLGAMLWEPKKNAEPAWSEVTGFTSPDAATLQDLLRQAVEAKVDYVVMEVTSHAIALGRVDGVEFDGAIFLNFSQDHLDFHGSLDEYKRVKKSFFTEFLKKQTTKRSPAIVLNGNDAAGAELHDELGLPHETLKRGDGYRVDESSLELSIQDSKTVVYPFVGHFQAENLVSAAYLVADLMGQDRSETLHQLRNFPGLPGRMEVLNLTHNRKRRNFIVDFAHTPGALEKNLQTLKKGMKKGQLWVMFGCGGDRDPTKRAPMGMIAAKYADILVITSDNPRTEDPVKIIEEIVQPLREAGTTFQAITSRKEAMKYCMENMKDTDICLVAGRGHEEFQIIGKEKIPFRDSEVLKSLSC